MISAVLLAWLAWHFLSKLIVYCKGHLVEFPHAMARPPELSIHITTSMHAHPVVSITPTLGIGSVAPRHPAMLVQVKPVAFLAGYTTPAFTAAVDQLRLVVTAMLPLAG